MNEHKPLTGHMVLYAMLGFFAVIFVVNGTFVYFALSSFPGTSTDHAYEKGVTYNKTLARAKQQAARGWSSQVTVSAQGQVVVRLVNRDGAMVGDQQVMVSLVRPARGDLDQIINLVEGPLGHYKGRAHPLLGGQWRAEITASQGDQTAFYIIHDLVVQD